MGQGTLTIADVYGIPASPYQSASPISGGGPNQSFVSPFGGGNGTMTVKGGTAPAISLVGLVLALVLLRIVVELGDHAG